MDRRQREAQSEIDVSRLIAELAELLATAGAEKPGSGGQVPIQQVIISGQGEPTLNRQFAGALEAILHLRALRQAPFFTIILMTNGVALHEPAVARALRLLCSEDEIWIKLDAGTSGWMDLVNRPEAPVFEQVLSNILELGRRRAIVVQSLFPQLSGRGYSAPEVDSYARVLRQLAAAGAQISQVQIYSASAPTAEPGCGHLPLRVLSDIARQVRQQTGLKVEVF